MNAKIYHNPRCSKSRKALELFNQHEIEVVVIEYLKTGLKEDEVKGIIEKLGERSSSLIRTNEQEYKDAPFSLESNDEIIRGLVTSPKVLQRPLIVSGEQAFIGRPTELVEDFIKELTK